MTGNERFCVLWYLGCTVFIAVFHPALGFGLAERVVLCGVGLVTLWLAAVRVGPDKLRAYPGSLAAHLVWLTVYGAVGALVLSGWYAAVYTFLVWRYVRDADKKDPPPTRRAPAKDVALDARWTWLRP